MMESQDLLRLIDTAADEQWTELDLAGMNLTELPPEIGKLTQLEKLILGKRDNNTRKTIGNALTSLPPEIDRLVNLTELIIDTNLLTDIPQVILSLPKLTSLSVNENRIENLPDWLAQMNLTELYLDSNQIAIIPEAIGNLTSLTTLSLDSNQIAIVPEAIGKLTSLNSLFLRGNQIAIVPEAIGKLTSLTKLYLRGNQIAIIPEAIGKLTSLTMLSLGINQIAIIPEAICKLTSLNSLFLHSNQIAIIPKEIGNLTSLTTLSLGSNQIGIIPEEIGNLTSLTTLFLDSNQIAIIPEAIGKLTNLTILLLQSNQIAIIPEAIGKLTSLTELLLQSNQIAIIPEAIGNLTNLTTLDLHSNQIAIIPEAIGKLTNLTILGLDSNQIAIIPDAIGNLTNLTTLYLDSNQIAIIPESIGNLTNLTTLYLDSNQIAIIPEAIGLLTSLTGLYLDSNQIAIIPESIAKLTSLTELYIKSNQIAIIPQWFQSFNNLEKLDLRGNQLPISIEILGPKDLSKDPGDLRSILEFYFQTQDPQARETLYEAKFIIVGEGESGKTTLAKKIQDSDYQLDIKQKSTEGIDIIRWEFQHNGKPFRVNIWDFGGQEIYHATHQFFLTERSLYTLLIDNRRDSPNSEYWLNIIRLLSGDSPVFITKNEKQDRQCELGEGELRRKFLQLKESIPTNFATNRGLREIRQAIQQYVTNLPHINIPIPKTWVRVRNVLENYAQNQNYIDVEKYRSICLHNGITDPTQMSTLGKHLHDLGICLYFQQNPTLKHLVILNPSWATNAVYKVTDAKSVIEHKGRFTTTDLQTIWDNRQYAEMQDELLELMKNFSICYPIRNLPHTYIAPSLLSRDRPKYKWKVSESLTFRYKYGFMPKGILTRFIVEMHDKIEQLPPPALPSSQSVWKTGVILADKSARAEVIEDYYNKHIRIRVVGFGRKSLLDTIRREFEKIHSSYAGLEYQEIIPCNCPQCKDTEKPHTYIYESLLRRLENNRFEVECEKSYLPVNIRRIIDEVIEPKTNINLDMTPAEIRQLIDAALTDNDLSNLCYDEFPKVYSEFDGKTRSAKIRDLVEYVNRQDEIPKLLRAIEQINPHADKLSSGRIHPTDFRGKLDGRERVPIVSPSQLANNSSPVIVNIHNHNAANNNMPGDTNFNSYGSGDNIHGDKVMGDKINTQINNNHNLVQAAADIKSLLDQLSEEYNPNTATGQQKISDGAIAAIEQNPTLKGRVVKAIKEGSMAALTSAIDHPVAAICVAAFKGFTEGE
jgi:Leucine-rich repeat (LRR) protein/GTPase SAR1 family protein